MAKKFRMKKILAIAMTMVLVLRMTAMGASAKHGGGGGTSGGGGTPASGTDTVTVTVDGQSTAVFVGDANDLAGTGDSSVTISAVVSGNDEDGYTLTVTVAGAAHADGTKNDLDTDRTVADGASYDTGSATVTYTTTLSGTGYTTGNVYEGVVDGTTGISQILCKRQTAV